MQKIEPLMQELVAICQSSFKNKLFAGTSGNLSVCLREEGIMLITPTGIRYETMEPEDIVQMRLNGTVLEGRHDPSSEWAMHAEIYQQCPDTGAVFHTHSPFATAFAAARQKIPYILIEMKPFLGGEVTCARFAQAGTRELGLSAVEELKDGRTSCLLASHGVVAIGKNLAQARIRAEYVEDAATIYYRALQIGQPVVLS